MFLFLTYFYTFLILSCLPNTFTLLLSHSVTTCLFFFLSLASLSPFFSFSLAFFSLPPFCLSYLSLVLSVLSLSLSLSFFSLFQIKAELQIIEKLLFRAAAGPSFAHQTEKVASCSLILGTEAETVIFV